jgi:hypothetical protein
MIINKLHDNIYYYERAINNPKDLLNHLDKNVWERWMSSDGGELYGHSQGAMFGSEEIGSTINEKNGMILKEIFNSAIFAANNYSDSTGIDIGYLPPFFAFKKYNTGIGMGPHVDKYSGKDKKSTLSMVIYLNDDSEGGEIEFANQGILLKPKAGSIIVFPPGKPYMHESKKVTEGNKYMIPLFFFKDKKPRASKK